MFTEIFWRSEPTIFYARRYGKYLNRWAYSPEQLVVAVSNRLGMQDAAIHRQKWMLGRLGNWLLCEDPIYIEFSGVHLSQLLERGGFRTPEYVQAGTTYLVRRDVVETCYAALTETPQKSA